ncbi:MAG: ABC transporter ATP-binding protein [Bacteroidales bacterium]|nr:ABC transporter ATP-binding protein [Bacteroidales bacterium]
MADVQIKEPVGNPSVRVEALGKSYGSVKALDRISFSAGRGEIFGLIGPDGAGKTTLFRILTSLMVPDAGTAMVEGFDVVRDFREIRKIVGYMPGRFSLYYDLSVEENLHFFATVFGVDPKKNYDLIRDIYIQIEPFRKRPAGKLSGGMKQKLALSCALIHAPKVLILDEPTTGVDAVSRKEFWEMLARLKEMGITVLVSTPYMDEAALCDRVALIQKGSLMGVDTPSNLNREYPFLLFSVTTSGMTGLIQTLTRHPEHVSAFRFGDSVHFAVRKGSLSPEELQLWLLKEGHKEPSIREISAGTEDCFMEYMSR